MAEYIEYHPLKFWLDPASIAEIVAHIQRYLVDNPINSATEIETIIHDYLIAHPELIGVVSVNGETGEVVLNADDIIASGNVTIKDMLDSLQNQINEIANKFESGIDLSDLSPMLQDAFHYEYEQINVTLSIGYINTDGQYVDYATAKYASIPVESGQHYKLRSQHGVLMKMFVLVDSDNNVIEYYPLNTVSTVTETKEITIPLDGTLYLNTFSSNTAQVYLANGITAEKEPLENIWYLFGDSWSAPVEGESKWCYYVAKALSLTQYNFAVSGTGYKKGTSYFGKRINDKLPAGFSGIITVFGSGNDCDNSVWDLGTSNDLFNPDDSTSQDTICGRINYAFNVIKTKAPLAKVLIIGPCPWQIYSPNVANNKMLQYIPALKECSEKAGFVFVDMYYRSGLRPWDNTQADLWVEQSPSNRVHPNPDGHYFLYPQMTDIIRQMLPTVAQSE